MNFPSRRRISIAVVLLGFAFITFAYAMSGPIVGAAASPLALPMLVVGPFIVVIGLLMLWRWR